MQNNIGTLAATIALNSAQLTKDIAKVNSLLNQESNKIKSVFGKIRPSFSGISSAAKTVASKVYSTFKTLGSKLINIFKKLTLFGGLASALGGGLGAGKSLSMFTDWEVAWKKIGNVTSQSLDDVKQSIFGMSSELGGATELVKGYYQVLSAGVTDQIQSLELLTTASQVAKEANLDQAETVKGLASFMRSYKDELTSSSRAADLLYSIEKYGITQIQEIIPEIGRLAAQASVSGIKSNELAAALAQITTAGDGTSMAATKLASLMRGLAKPTDELTAIFSDYESVLSGIQEMGFERAIQRIGDAAKEGPGLLADNLFTLFGRAEAVNGILMLLQDNGQGFRDKLEGMAESIGAQQSAWNRYQSTLKSIWETFKNTIGNQLVLIGEKLAPSIKELISSASQLLEEWRDPITEWFAEKIDTLDVNFRRFKESFKDAGGMDAIEGIFTKLDKALTGIIVLFGDLNGSIANLVQAGFDTIDKALGGILTNAKELYESGALESFFKTALELATQAVKAFGSIAESVGNISGVIDKIKREFDIFFGWLGEKYKWLKSLFSFEGVKSMIAGAAGSISDLSKVTSGSGFNEKPEPIVQELDLEGSPRLPFSEYLRYAKKQMEQFTGDVSNLPISMDIQVATGPALEAIQDVQTKYDGLIQSNLKILQNLRSSSNITGPGAGIINPIIDTQLQSTYNRLKNLQYEKQQSIKSMNRLASDFGITESTASASAGSDTGGISGSSVIMIDKLSLELNTMFGSEGDIRESATRFKKALEDIGVRYGTGEFD